MQLTYTNTLYYFSSQLKVVQCMLLQIIPYLFSIIIKTENQKPDLKTVQQLNCLNRFPQACFKRRATAKLSWLDCSSTAAARH